MSLKDRLKKVEKQAGVGDKPCDRQVMIINEENQEEIAKARERGVRMIIIVRPKNAPLETKNNDFEQKGKGTNGK